jgi:hypothetical protein
MSHEPILVATHFRARRASKFKSSISHYRRVYGSPVTGVTGSRTARTSRLRSVQAQTHGYRMTILGQALHSRMQPAMPKSGAGRRNASPFHRTPKRDSWTTKDITGDPLPAIGRAMYGHVILRFLSIANPPASRGDNPCFRYFYGCFFHSNGSAAMIAPSLPVKHRGYSRECTYRYFDDNSFHGSPGDAVVIRGIDHPPAPRTGVTLRRGGRGESRYGLVKAFHSQGDRIHPAGHRKRPPNRRSGGWGAGIRTPTY